MASSTTRMHSDSMWWVDRKEERSQLGGFGRGRLSACRSLPEDDQERERESSLVVKNWTSATGVRSYLFIFQIAVYFSICKLFIIAYILIFLI